MMDLKTLGEINYVIDYLLGLQHQADEKMKDALDKPIAMLRMIVKEEQTKDVYMGTEDA